MCVAGQGGMKGGRERERELKGFLFVLLFYLVYLKVAQVASIIIYLVMLEAWNMPGYYNY